MAGKIFTINDIQCINILYNYHGKANKKGNICVTIKKCVAFYSYFHFSKMNIAKQTQEQVKIRRIKGTSIVFNFKNIVVVFS